MSMRNKKVLILGGSRYYLKGIQKAKSLGYKVLIVDKNPDSPAFKFADKYEVIDITDKEEVLKFSLREKIDGILAVNDYGVPTAAYVSSKLKIPGIPPEVARIATDKFLMRDIWKKNAIPVPKFKKATTQKEAREFVEFIKLPVIFKPTNSIGGASRGVIYVDELSKVNCAFNYTKSFYMGLTDVLIEEFITGIEHSAECLVYQGNVSVIAISDKIKTPLPYRVDKDVLYPTKIVGEKLKQIVNIIERAIKAIGMENGVAHVELCSNENGVFLYEIGARCGGGGTPDPIIPFVTGVEEFIEAIRISLGEPIKNLTPLWSKGCVYHFITPKPGKVKSIKISEEIKSIKEILDFEVFIRPMSVIKEVKVGPDRSGFIIVGHQEREKAYELANYIEKNLIKIIFLSN